MLWACKKKMVDWHGLDKVFGLEYLIQYAVNAFISHIIFVCSVTRDPQTDG